ncbi:MAG: long-chain fatty acid--CoA ligase [Bacteroidetes bacterium HGW-Bacteroidetes-6]|jgi:long-chain acyl-CoA synthetase|nr:MAG: long-chain fatty acid--CoA ligase [Bacteroidetes bacterium HGW-Bacteroidetes-6]
MKTLVNLFENAIASFGENPLVWEKVNGKYQSTSYSEAGVYVKNLAGGLMKAGLRANDKVVLYSEGRAWWLFSELAVIAAGAVCVPVSVRIEEPEELLFRIQHSESSFVIVSSRFLDLVRTVKTKFHLTQKIIIIDLPLTNDIDKLEDEFFLSELLEEGESSDTETHNRLAAVASYARPDDAVNICYTSGTTADPKGIVLTHQNYIANVKQATAMFEVTPEFVTLLMLPWDHSFAHTVGLYSLIYKGASLAAVDGGKSAVEALRNVPLNIREIKPVFLLSVPALAKNFKNNIEKGISEKGAMVRMLFRMFLRIGMIYHGTGNNAGKGMRVFLRPLVKLGDALVFSKIRDGFGGRLRFFIGGGALLDIDIQKFFNAIGIPMYQGYGLSEAAPVISTNGAGIFKMGSSGRIVPDLELVIADENGQPLSVGQTGEICVKGDNVMKGYWKNDEATAETLQDGFLHTGDLGYVDSEGFLFVKGRFKSLLIANDGEKYSPEALEEAMIFHSSLLSQVYLHNNQNPYTTALVYLDDVQLRKMLLSAAVDFTSSEGKKKALELITHEINKLRFDTVLAKQYPSRWLPSVYCLLEDGFTEKNHLLNSTMKIVRPKIEQVYENLFEMMYAADGKSKSTDYNIRLLEKFLQ